MIASQTKLSNTFGLVIEKNNGIKWSDLDPTELIRAFKEHRTLYFKDWDFNLEDFQEISRLLCCNFSSYEGGGFRFKQLDREFVNSDKTIMTTTGHTQGFAIPLHGEMYYMGKPPDLIWFFCKTTEGNTGQTTLCDGRELARSLPEHVLTFFSGKKIKYQRYLPDGAWQSTFMTEDVEQAKEICKEQNVDFEYDKAKNQFTTEYAVSPFVVGKNAAEPAFVNNMLNIFAVEWAFESGWVKSELGLDLGERCPMIVRMEDGSRIPAEVINTIREVAENITIDIPWRPGEVVMVDNLSVMHGRRESTNPRREVFVRMGDYNF